MQSTAYVVLMVAAFMAISALGAYLAYRLYRRPPR